MKSAADLRKPASTLAAANPAGCRVVTGFDGFIDEMITLVGERHSLDDFTPVPDIRGMAATLRGLLGISRVVVHRIAFAVSSSADGGFAQAGPLCPHPKKSTGAGDRFNAGFRLGLALGMDDADSLALGCATAGFFVRHARSAGHAELVDFLNLWEAGTID